MTTKTARRIDTQRHVNAVIDVWHRLGRQAAAEELVTHEGADLATARLAAAMLREQAVESLHGPVIATANYLRCADGECPEGTL